ncbi:MAG: hypothetical protein K8L97_31005 [Anaerolineae bacterium]|nr:hypothetical protein [Anaerolineae bacterium]
MQRHSLLLFIVLVVLFGSSIVVHATTYSIQAQPNETCTFTANDGSHPVTVTADNSGSILYVGNHGPGTVISYGCNMGSGGTITVPGGGITPTLETETETRSTETPTPQAPIGTACTYYNDVNIRDTSSLGGNVIATMVQHDSLPVYERRDSDGLVWYRTDQGWVAGTNININSSCNNTVSPSPTENPFRAELDGCQTYLTEEFAPIVLAAVTARTSGDAACDMLQDLVNNRQRGDLISQDLRRTLFDICPSLDQKYAGLVPEFLAWMYKLTPDVRTAVEGFFQGLSDSTRCEFVYALLVDGKLGDLPSSFPLRYAIDMVALACDPNQSSPVLSLAREHVQALGLTTDDLEALDVNACQTITVMKLIGGFDPDNPEQEWLYHILNTTCQPPKPTSEAVELVAYAIGMGINLLELKEMTNGNNMSLNQLCMDPYAIFRMFRVNDPLDDDPALAAIAGALQCQPESDRFILIMLLHNRWDDLTSEQQILLLNASDSCKSAFKWLTTGVLPDGESTQLTSDPTFGQQFTDPNRELVETKPGCALMLDRLCEFPFSSNIAVFLAEDQNTGHTVINRLNLGVVEDALGYPETDSTEYPVLDWTHTFLAYYLVDTEGNFRALKVLNLENQEVQSFNQSWFSDFGFSMVIAPVAWVPNSASSNDISRRLLVTLIDNNNQSGIYELYLNEPSAGPIQVLSDATSPAYAPILQSYTQTETRFLAFERNNQIGVVLLSMYGLPEEGHKEELIPNPDGTDGCFAPVFEYQYLSLLFTCEVDGSREFWNYTDSGTVSEIDILSSQAGLDPNSLGNLSPGPVPDYIAFDNGTAIWFTYISRENPDKRRTDDLLQMPGRNVFKLRWAVPEILN